VDIPKYLTLHKDGCENLKSQNNVVNKTSQLFIRHSLFRLYRPVKGRKVLYCIVLYYGNKTNDYIRRELRITGILDKIDEYGRNWLSHLQRMPQNRIPLKAYHYRPQGRRTIGRPKKHWREQLLLWRWNGSKGPILDVYDDDDDDVLRN